MYAGAAHADPSEILYILLRYSSLSFPHAGLCCAVLLITTIQGQGLSLYQAASWSIQSFQFGHNTPTSQTDVQTRQDRQRDNGPISSGEQFYKRSPKNCKIRCIYTTTSVGQLLTRIHAKNVKKSASALCTNRMLLIYLFFVTVSRLMTSIAYWWRNYIFSLKSSVKPPLN